MNRPPLLETTLNLVEVAKLIREADPQVLIYTDPTSGTTMESVDMYKELIDIWCPSYELLTRLGSDLLPVAREYATEMWYYDAPGRAKTLSPLSHYRRWIWYAEPGFTGAGGGSSHITATRTGGTTNSTGNFYPTAYDSPTGSSRAAGGGIARPSRTTSISVCCVRRSARRKPAASTKAFAEPRRLLTEMPAMEETLRATGRRWS